MYILWNIYNKFPQTVIQIIIFTIIIITLGRTGGGGVDGTSPRGVLTLQSFEMIFPSVESF